MERLSLSFLVVVVVHSVAATEGTLPGPCREWLFPCVGGRWQCTSEEAYQRFQLGPKPLCPVTPNKTPPTPPPGQHCQLVNGVCQYTSSNLVCGVQDIKCSQPTCKQVPFVNETCPPVNDRSPSPDKLCLPINGSCQWFNPCHAWRGHCLSPYCCGTISEYYAFLFGPTPRCAKPPEGWVEPVPPGECLVNGKQECAWSNCTAFMNWCQSGWTCGTQYDLAVHLASPPPSCPQPLPSPAKPGPCVFNLEAQKCKFKTGTGPKPAAALPFEKADVSVREPKENTGQ